MKFDTSRAVEFADSSAFPRAAGTENDRRVSDMVAEQFALIGLQVERRDVMGSRFPSLAVPWLGWLGVGVWATAGLLLAERGWSAPWRLAPLGLGLFWFRLTLVHGFRFGWGWPPRAATQNVFAARRVVADPTVRVVFLAPFDAASPARGGARWQLATLVIAVLLTILFLDQTQGTASQFRLPRSARWSVLGLIWLAVCLRAWRAWRAAAGGDNGNSSGLGLLMELARTWPRATAERIDTRFVAAGGQALDFAGARDLVRAIRAEWPAKPTLVVVLDAPGIGAGIVLGASRQRKLAEAAATDLWVPHQVLRSPEALVAFWPFESKHRDFVCLIGDRALESASLTSIDPESLQRAAQLATEIALRWGKTNKSLSADDADERR